MRTVNSLQGCLRWQRMRWKERRELNYRNSKNYSLKLEMISDLKQKIVNPYQLALTVMGEQAKRYV